jgi:hypothetical protein
MLHIQAQVHEFKERKRSERRRLHMTMNKERLANEAHHEHHTREQKHALHLHSAWKKPRVVISTRNMNKLFNIH